jgi:hypothetical protein
MATFYGPRAPIGPNDGDEWVNQTTGERRIWAGNAWSIPTAGGQILAANGSASAPGFAFSGNATTGIYQQSNSVRFAVAGAIAGMFTATGQMAANSIGLDLSNTDTLLVRDAAGTLALKNGTNAQTIRWYKTTTGPQYAYVDTTGILIGTSGFAFTNGAAAATGTLTNAPTAGNPTKWIPVDDNGTTRYIPAW